MLYKKVLKEIPPRQLDKVATPRKSDMYLGVAQLVKDTKCGEILVVDIYKKGNVRDVKFRFFSDGKTYQFYNVTKDEWSRNSYPVVIGGKDDYDYYYYTPTELKMYASAESMDTMRKFLGQKYGSSGDDVISFFISNKKFDERCRARARKEERINSRMDMFPEYPKGLDEFLRNRVFGNYLIVGKKCGDTREFECTACNRKGKIRGDVLHKSLTECPKCGKSVAVWKKQYVESIRRKAKVCIASRVDDQLLLRWTEVLENWCKNAKGKFVPSYLKEDYFRTMYLVVKGKPSIHHFNNINIYGYKGWRETQWQKDDSVYVYDGNLREVFGEKYYNVDLQFELGKKMEKICFVSLLDNLKNIKATEYLLKMGMVNLAYQINFNTVNDGKDFGSILGVNPQYKAMYRKFNVSLHEHRIMQVVKEYVSEDDFIKMRSLDIFSCSLETVMNLLSKMSFKKAINYFGKQKQIHPKEGLYHLIIWYNDYIRMSEQMGVDLSHKSVRFPKDIKTAHDDLITKFKAIEMEIYDEQMRKATENLYNGLTEYKSDGYAIVFPKSRTEFVKEGQSLNHCVGTQEMYFNNHMEGTRMIFFIRNEEEIEKPFVTMEIDMRELRIRQIYGYGDKTPAKEVRDFADKFLKLLKKDAVRRTA